MNILMKAFDTPFDSTPFSCIHNDDFKPAFEQAILIARQEILNITSTPDPASFDNTIAALAESGLGLDRIASIFFNLNAAETSEHIQKIAQEISPQLAALNNDIILNSALFNRVKSVYQQKGALVKAQLLTQEQQTLLDKTYQNFLKNGALLTVSDQATLREIDQSLSGLSLTFAENVLADSQAFSLHLTQIEDLAGLPEAIQISAAELAKKHNKEGWIFTLDFPSYLPFITHSQHRHLRQKMFCAFGARGFQNNAFNNEKNVLTIAKLRHQRAQLLGYSTHAEFVLEDRMAKTPQKVRHFLNELLEKSKPAAKKEFESLQDFAKKTDGIAPLQKWDIAYYSEKLKQQLFDLNDETLRPYFALNNVLNGAFTIAKKLYGIEFVEIFDIDTYSEDVTTYRVNDAKGQLLAIFYADFFPRKGKRQGAWMTSYKPQMIKEGVNHRPHISIVCNFSQPTEQMPSLLTFSEVTTLFHEFGHSLHGIMANTRYPTLSGTNVLWDFVELPSQIMENWCYEPEALALFAHHYQTGEVIPHIYIDQIKNSANFLEGLASVRQLSFGLLDMAWHDTDPSVIADLKAFETLHLHNTQFCEDVPQNAMSTAFSHIFAGGYSAAYYSYKWAEVLDADAFEYFQTQGIFDKTTAQSFCDHVLSKGGTENPMALYERFRGRAPQMGALLKRAGLIACISNP